MLSSLWVLQLFGIIEVASRLNDWSLVPTCKHVEFLNGREFMNVHLSRKNHTKKNRHNHCWIISLVKPVDFSVSGFLWPWQLQKPKEPPVTSSFVGHTSDSWSTQDVSNFKSNLKSLSWLQTRLLKWQVYSNTCDGFLGGSWICLSMHGFCRLAEFWALNIHSLWIDFFCTAYRPNMNQYSQARRHLGFWIPIIDSTDFVNLLRYLDEFSLTRSFPDLSSFPCAKRPLPKLSSFCWEVNSRQFIPRDVTYWEVTHPEIVVGTNISHPKGSFLSNLLE